MRPAQLNHSCLPFLLKREFALCNVQVDETIVLMSDLTVRPEFIGSAFAGGGINNTRAHLDLPMFDCTVMVDNRTVIEKGRIVDPAMIVKPVYTNRIAY